MSHVCNSFFYPLTEREHLGAQLLMTSISSGQACIGSNYIQLHSFFFFCTFGHHNHTKEETKKTKQKRTKMVPQFYYGMF